MIEPCTCAPVPAHSSREAEPGAELVDVLDARGRWHAVKVGAVVYRQVLVTPSAQELAELAAEAAARASAPVPINPLAALARLVKGEATAEDRAAVDKLAAADAAVKV